MVSPSSAHAQTVQNQIVTPSQTNLSVSPGSHATFDVNYSTSPTDSTLSGLGLRMYYNSSLLDVQRLEQRLVNGEDLAAGPRPTIRTTPTATRPPTSTCWWLGPT